MYSLTSDTRLPRVTSSAFIALSIGFAALAAKGAAVQRPLWASTSTKNPAYPDLMYVETVVGKHTVNTMPPATPTSVISMVNHSPCIRKGKPETMAEKSNPLMTSPFRLHPAAARRARSGT